MSLPITLARAGEHTHQEQIYQHIRDGVLGGVYRTGCQLPSTRDLAASLRVSRNTVMLAYDWLTSEGYIETRRGAGTFVGKVVEEGVAVPADPGRSPTRADRRDRPAVVAPYRTPVLIGRAASRPQFDFWYGRPDPRQFPLKTWRRLIIENLARATNNFVEYGAQAGDLELRRAIADHLASARGFAARADRILITAGAQDGLNVISRLLVRPGTTVAVENPCYASAASLFESYGAKLSPIDVDEEGLKRDGLAAIAAATLLYTTPSHQFPTGAVLGLARRQAVLAWAEAANAYVIEDDYDSEVTYDRPPLAALAALDQHHRVIYLGSFSKTIGAGMRVGYLVLPDELFELAVAVKSLASYGQPWLDQVVLASLMREGGFRAHLRRIRTLYRSRRDTLVTALQRAFGEEVALSGHEAGLHLVWTLPPHLPDADEFSATARTVGVGLYTPARAGALEFGAGRARENRLGRGYAALTSAEIETAIRRVAATLGHSTARVT